MERLRTKLAKVGYDEETVATADRTVLQNMYAEYLIAPPEIVAAAADGATKGGMTEEELDLRLQELESKKKAEERKEEDMELRKKAEERAEREYQHREEEKELRKKAEKRAKKQREAEMELRKKAEERAEKEREEEMQLKEKELLLREQKLMRQQQKDKMDELCKESVAGLTKYYGGALKHALPRMGHDSSDYPAYFLAVENRFFPYTRYQRKFNRNYSYHCLMSKAKTLLAKLARDKLDDYAVVKDYLLREFKLTPQQYADKYLSAQ